MTDPESPAPEIPAGFDLEGKSVWVAGHRGMVGAALVRRLAREDCRVLTCDRSEVDLERQDAVEVWLEAHRPDLIFLAAAKVGGILANDTYPADFLGRNLAIQTNVISTAARLRTPKLVFLGSSCIYPREAPQPMAESALLTGPLEPTNQWYAIAKIAGMKLAEACRRQHGLDFVSVMPTNLYGPGDDFHPTESHVIAALIRRFHAAKEAGLEEVVVWGTGAPLREFLHVDDMADACVFLARRYSDAQTINVGSGQEVSIRVLAERIQAVVGFGGRLVFDTTKPDGAPRKRLDTGRLDALGWRSRIALDAGLAGAYSWFLDHVAVART